MEIEIIAILVLIAFSAFFSASEAAILTVSRIRLKYLKGKYPHDKGLASLLRIKARLPHTIMTILVGNNIANISASFLAAHVTTTYYEDIYLGFAMGVLTLAVLIFAEIIPKNYATAHSDSLAMKVSRPIEVLTYLLTPLIFILERISMAVPGTYTIGGKKVYFSEDEIRSVLEVGVEDRAISHDEKILLERVLDFNDTYVKEIMTPAADVAIMRMNDTVSQALKKASEYRKNRYPVLDENGKPVGVISQRQLLVAKKSEKLQKIMHTPYFVSRESVAHRLFRNLQRDKRQLAIVLASDGSMDGIVTVEDLLEEIVGEIEEKPAHMSKQSTKAELIVSGDARLHDVEKELGITFEDSQSFGSVAAFVQYKLRRLPVVGDVIICSKARIEVAEVAKDFSLTRVKVSKILN